MSVIGIVSEFNPFHKGHKYLIDSVKKDGDVIVCVMSGNFVQRAEPAIFDKKIRTLAALKCGVDIVLELPFVYATASAEIFAENAVKILYSFGCEKLAFGCEDDNISQLDKAADLLLDDNFNEKLMSFYAQGISYPAARQKAFDLSNISVDLSKSNNILALEYIKAIKKNNYSVEILPVKRQGEEYNQTDSTGDFLSATHIRQLMLSGKEYNKYIPNECNNIYKKALTEYNVTDYEKYDIAITALLKNIAISNFSEIAYMSEGLENKILKSIDEFSSLAEICDDAKSKRYTFSRIKRAILSLAFDISKEDIVIPAAYCRLLGFNSDRSDILGKLANQSKLPYIVSLKDASKFSSKKIDRLVEIESKTTKIFNLASSGKQKLSEQQYSPVKI